MPELKTYPPHDGYRGGAKVAWYYYKDEAVAREAAKVARYNTLIRAAQGYDFGFCAPGAITRMTGINGGKFAGMWEVCIP